MADVTVKRLDDFEAVFGGGMRRVRAGLGVTSFGMQVYELPPSFEHLREQVEPILTPLPDPRARESVS